MLVTGTWDYLCTIRVIDKHMEALRLFFKVILVSFNTNNFNQSIKVCAKFQLISIFAHFGDCTTKGDKTIPFDGNRNIYVKRGQV